MEEDEDHAAANGDASGVLRQMMQQWPDLLADARPLRLLLPAADDAADVAAHADDDDTRPFHRRCACGRHHYYQLPAAVVLQLH